MSSRELPAEADIVVIGAGVAGAATASCLREAGLHPLVLDRAPAPGREASGRSAGMIREQAGDAAVAELTREGAAWHRSEGAAHFRPGGSFLLGLDGEWGSSEAGPAGAGSNEDEVSTLVPWAQGRGRFFPGDGLCDTEGLLRRLLGGLRIRWNTPVDEIRSADAGLVVSCGGDELHARIVVNAAGAWAGRLGELPLEPRRRHLFRTAERPPGDCAPFVWDLQAGLYFRPEGAGLLLCACDEAPGEPGDNAVQPEAEALLRSKLRRLQPALAEIPIVDAWAGQRTFAPDGRFVLGWDPRLRGLYHVAALGGHGITVAPALGRRAAEELKRGPEGLTRRLEGPGGKPLADGGPFAPERLLD